MKLRGITLTIKKNPFNCDGREIHQIEYEPGKSISDYCAPFAEPEVDFVYGINGKVVDGDAVPNDGDFITICPVVGKNILSTILTVGLMVFTGGLYGVAGSIGAFGIKAGTILAGLVQASVMLIGGALITMLCPPQTADTTIDIKQSDPLYTWGNIDSQTEQGGALAKTYGTMKTSGTILSRHVTTDGKNQYLNILLTGGEGPIDSISDIRINDNPIGNYDGVVVETRLGTNDQTVIANFNDSFADEGLAYELELSGGYSTQLTSGNATQGLEVALECSNGLYYMNDDSSLSAASVTYQLQYRLAGGAWQDWGTFTISGAESTAVRSVRRLDNLAPGQYEVRAQCTAKSGTSTRYSTRLFWTQVTTIIYDDFVRPGKTLVGIKALATSQLSGSSINVTWLQTRSTVNVWNGSAYVKKPATNHAWVAYDMLHGCRELKNIHTGLIENVVGNVAASRFIYSDFEAWADHCDSLGLSFNHIFTEAADLWDALKIPELFGRGKVIQRGTKFGCTCDKPGIPVQLFTVGNIANESYSKDILPITDRANAVEISFVNAAKNYTKDTFVVYSEDYDTDGVIKSPTQITLAGCVNYAQAYQHGKYLLRVNKLILRTITLKADIDAIGCQYGDQVLVQHDVPRWGEGGRIQEATTLTLKLDRKVVMVSGESYGVIVRLSDDTLVTKTVITQPGETDIITVSNAFESVPQEQDLYSFGLINKIAKPFIVIDVDRDDDKRATISAIEYVEAVYEESLDAPVINYGDYAIKPLVISVAETYPRPTDGTAKISVSWIWPRDSRNAKAIIYAGKTAGEFARIADVGLGDLIGTIITLNANATWLIKVDIVDAFGGLIATGQSTKTLSTTDLIPSSVASLSISLSGSELVLAWPPVSSSGVPTQGYHIRRGNSYATGQLAAAIAGADASRTKLPALRGTHKYWIVAYNQYGVSPNPAGDSITITSIPKQNYVDEKTNYEEAGELSGSGKRFSGLLIQGSTLTYPAMESKTWSELAALRWMDPVGTAIVTGDIVDIGKAATVLLSVVEKWMRTPDVANIWEYKASNNNIDWTEWALVPLGEVYGRYFQFRLTVGGLTQCGILESASIVIDVPEKTYPFMNTTVPIGGIDVMFFESFVQRPILSASAIGAAVKVLMTPIAGDPNFLTGVHLEVWSDTAEVGGIVDLSATGF